MPLGIYKRTKEHKKRISASLMGNKRGLGYKLTESQLLKLKLKREVQKRPRTSAMTKRKLSEAMVGKTPWKGKHHAENTKSKLSRMFRGDKGSAWQGGKSFEPYTIDWTKTLKRSIRERDNYICQICSHYGKEVHHIDYNKNNCNPDNLIVLCVSCHAKTNFNRLKWEKYFNNFNYRNKCQVI